MTRAVIVVVGAALVTTTGCSSGRADQTLQHPGPATSELTRLFSAGEITPERMSCVIPATIPVAEEARVRARTLREAEARMFAVAAEDHARSVQDGMTAAEIQVAAAEATQANQRAVAYFEANGQFSKAATQADYGMSLREYARERGEIWVQVPVDGGVWSEDEASLLVEYAQLRAERASSDVGADVDRRLSEIEGESPDVVNEYSALLMDLYFDPGLPCEVGR